ncbi:unnamed protein product [Lampetra fluviatilis]
MGGTPRPAAGRTPGVDSSWEAGGSCWAPPQSQAPTARAMPHVRPRAFPSAQGPSLPPFDAGERTSPALLCDLRPAPSSLLLTVVEVRQQADGVGQQATMFGKGVKRKLTEEDAVGMAGGLLLLPGASGAVPPRCPLLPCAAPGPGRAYALQRQTVMSLSLGKLQEVRGQVEPCLRRYVAVTNTLRRIQEELRQEGVSRPLLPPWVSAGVGAQGPPPDRSCAETPPHSLGRGVAGSPSFALLPPSSSTLPLLLPPAVDLRSEAGGPEGSLCAISKLCHDDDEDDGDNDDGRGGGAGAPPRAEPVGRTRCACWAGAASTRGDARPPAAACGCARRDASAETEPSERAAGPPAPGPSGRSPPDARAPPVPEMPFGGGGGVGCLDGTATAFLLPELSLDDVFTDVDTAMYDFDLFAPSALAGGRGAGPAAGDEWPRGGVPAPCSSATGGSPQFKADLSELDHIMEVLHSRRDPTGRRIVVIAASTTLSVLRRHSVRTPLNLDIPFASTRTWQLGETNIHGPCQETYRRPIESARSKVEQSVCSRLVTWYKEQGGAVGVPQTGHVVQGTRRAAAHVGIVRSAKLNNFYRNDH